VQPAGLVVAGAQSRKPLLAFNAFGPSSGGPIRAAIATTSNAQGGVFVAAGQVEGAGNPPQILVGQGSHGTGLLSVFDDAASLLETLQPFGAKYTGGVDPAAADVNGAGSADILAGAGQPATAPLIRAYDGLSLKSIAETFALDSNYDGGLWLAGGGKWL